MIKFTPYNGKNPLIQSKRQKKKENNKHRAGLRKTHACSEELLVALQACPICVFPEESIRCVRVCLYYIDVHICVHVYVYIIILVGYLLVCV